MKSPSLLFLLAFVALTCLDFGGCTKNGSLVSAQEVETAETVAETDTTISASEQEAVEEEQQLDSQEAETEQEQPEEPVQAGPLIDLLGTKLQSLEIEGQNGILHEHYTNEALDGKRVIGLYFSADWCGPCRQFTPELVSFYEKMNKRRGKKDQFQIVWVSRCRDQNSHFQYFSHMPWLALPIEEATGARGQHLSDKYKVKGIPTLVLVDDLGQTITTDARNKIPQDRAGIGFPWRSPLAQLYSTLFPRSLRMVVKLQIDNVRTKMVNKLKGLVGFGKKPVSA
eukprot:CAMPEP_0178764750 /NCGR_PEP_ID=MMETSP0744-20121128/18005_1 /TAXON_ID=913974 /ORGANISM="Nitzschia punctata, Strain CCMP561" /LENGTH=282 /DNA_ID=CAMNT_0020420041 /DNA_START=45 /DNA_END=893 /DNA_ORIENTATION=+